MIYGQPVTFGVKADLQEKTVTPSTSQQVVTPDADYDGLSQVTVNAMTTATQATPSITVSSAGLITASATQTAGYVAAGTKSATKQLTVQAAKTITPSTSSQTAVASGRYTTGAVTVAGASTLKAANIASGVSIFGVTGTYTGAPVLLWTNSSPSSNFAAQTITVTSGYSAYLVELQKNTSDDECAIAYLPFISEEHRLVAQFHPDEDATVSSNRRNIVSAASGKIVFGSGYSGGTVVNNARSIPTRIWGVKWAIS